MKIPRREQIKRLADIKPYLANEQAVAQELWDSLFAECKYKMSPKCEKVMTNAYGETHFYRCPACEEEHRAWRESITSTAAVFHLSV